MSTPSTTLGHGDEVKALRQRIEEALQTLVPETDPDGLYGPVRYVLRNGGKRLRPVLLLLAAGMYDVDVDDAIPAALAVEVFHNFTLVHDDIMDRADERRGRPTVHVKWDESTAILCGDFLLGLSYALLVRSRSDGAARLVERFQTMVARLCEGQTLDTYFEGRSDVSVDEYLHMVDRKTGALLQACLEIGGMIGGAADDELLHLRGIGRDVGRAFQIQDDLLDLTAEDARWGKAVGGDLVEGKKTYILLRAMERAGDADREWLRRIFVEKGLAPELVPDARERITRSGVLDEARDEVFRYTREALDSTRRLPDTPATNTLRWLLRRMQDRMH